MQQEHPGKKTAGQGHAGFEHTLDIGQGTPLFSDIIKTEGLLDRKAREQVDRVILVYERKGYGVIGYPVMFTSHLMPVLFENFPNAEFNLFNGLGQFIKGPQGRVHPETQLFSHCCQSRWGGDKTVLLNMYGIEGESPPDEFKPGLILEFPDFGRCAAMHIKNLNDESLIAHPEFAISGYDGVYENQMQVLAKLGFENLPKRREDVLLTPERYSEKLAKAIEALEQELPDTAKGKPIIFLNPLKHMEGEVQCPYLWPIFMHGLAKIDDTAIVVNPGGADNPRSVFDRNEILGAYGMTKHKEAELVDLNLDNRLKLFAMLGLVRKTGGLLIGIETGTTHAAGWMDVAQFVVFASGSSRHYIEYLENRNNMEVIDASDPNFTPHSIDIERRTRLMLRENKQRMRE
jgi:hypothetical protein